MKTLKKPYVVAAIESNHNGDLDLGKDLVEKAVECGCDAIKVPVKAVRSCYSDDLLNQPCLDYPEWGNTFGRVLESLELDPKSLATLRDSCRGRIAFLGAPYDEGSLKTLEALGVDGYQIDSSLLTHHALLERIAKNNALTLIATGACTEADLESALAKFKDIPTILLHGMENDSRSLKDAALSYIPHYRQKYGLEVGYLGLEDGIEGAVASYALGACTIEKKLTVSRHLRGPDHASSLTPEEMKRLVECLRACEAALAPIGTRQVAPQELEQWSGHRVTLVAAKDLRAQAVLEQGMLTAKIGGRGISPRLLSRILGKKLLYDLPEGTPLTFGAIEL